MDLEQALHCSMTPGPHQQEALDFLRICSDDPNFFSQAAELFFTSNLEEIQFLAICMIYRYVDTKWNNISPEITIQFRSNLVQFFFMNTFSSKISAQVELTIASIAFNDWPENWPTFIDEVLSTLKNDNETEVNQFNEIRVERLVKTFHILQHLISFFSMSQFITLMRRNLLIQELQFKFPEIIDIFQSIPAEVAFQSNVGTCFVSFIQDFCKLNFDDLQFVANLMNFLFNNFANVVNSQNCFVFPDAFKALDNLIAKPHSLNKAANCASIEYSIFNLAIQNIIQIIQKQSYQNPQSLIEFICHLIKLSIPIFSQCCNDNSFFTTIRIILEFTILNSPKNCYFHDLWYLWAELLHQFIAGINLKTSALYMTLEPMIPFVLTGLYEYLPLTLDHARMIEFSPQSAIIAFTIIDEEMFFSFLSQKEISSAFLISLGIAHFLHDNETFVSMMDNIVPQVLQNINVDLNAALFMLSRNAKYLKNHVEILKGFINIISNLLSLNSFSNLPGNINSSHIALLTLNHLASEIPNELISHCMDFVLFLLSNFVDPAKFGIKLPTQNQLNQTPVNIDNTDIDHGEEDFLRLCRILSKLVASIENIEERQKFAEILANPIAKLLSGNTHEVIELGCKASDALASISSLSCTTVLQYLWEPISISLNHTKSSELFYVVCDCFATTIRTISWKQCFQVVESFFSFAQTVHNQDCAIVHSASQMRLCHREMDYYRQPIIDTYIQKLIREQQSNSPEFLEFLEFFEAFDVFENEEMLVLPIACQAIRSYDIKIAKTAIRLLTIHFKSKQIPFKVPCECEIISAVFDSLFDQMHRKCLKKLIQLLFQVINKMHKRQMPFEECVFTCLREKICDDELSQRFILSMKKSIIKEEMFSELIGDLLVAAGRANPSEIQMLSDLVNSRNKTKTFMSSIDSNAPSPFHNEDEIMK